MSISSTASGKSSLDLSAAREYRRGIRAKELRLATLVAPLFFFMLAVFAIPIVVMLFTSVRDPEISAVLPKTAELVRSWDGEGLPNDEVVSAFVSDVREASKNRSLGQAARRLNYAVPGFQALLAKTGRALASQSANDGIATLTQIDQRWSEGRYWLAIKNAANPYSLFYFKTALGLADEVSTSSDASRLYLDVIGRTLWMTAVVTVSCVILGYPLAYFLAHIPVGWRNVLILFVLLPFWTSLLVRTTAWFVLLQKHGLINDLGIALGLWAEPLELIHNRFGVYTAMIHVMLPFMVLPLYSVMIKIPKTYVNAALTLGANPLRAFKEVYLPLSFPGLSAGIMLVFIVTLGFYITPALLGGPGDQMLSYYIAQNASNFGNWGLAAALSVLLLAVVALVAVVVERLRSPSKVGGN